MIRSLTRVEHAWARAALGAIYPSRASEALPLGICDLDVDAFLTDLMRHIPLMAAFGLRVAIWIVALAPVVLMRRFVTVARLGALEQQALVVALLSSSSYGVRQLVVALKATGGLLFGAAASVRAAALGENDASRVRVEAVSGIVPVIMPSQLVRRAKEADEDVSRAWDA